MQYKTRQAGQIVQAPPAETSPQAPAAPPQMCLGGDGRITGLDGILDQIGESLNRQATPLLRDVMLPIIQRDKEMQKTIGAAAGIAAGSAAAKHLRLPLILLGVGVTGVAVALLWKAFKRDDE